jgi:hypothetical protein
MMQRRIWHDDGCRCVHYRWVEIKVHRDGRRSVGCTDPLCCSGHPPLR